MIINYLKLDQVRGFHSADLHFQPGFNLIIGENGTGKSTILWTLRVLLSHALRDISPSKEAVINFTERDIEKNSTTSWPFLNINLEISLIKDDTSAILKYFAQKSRQYFARGNEGNPRTQAINTPDIYRFATPILNAIMKREMQHPIAVFYSPHRSIASERNRIKRKTVGFRAIAYAEALLERDLRIDELIEFWKKESDLLKSDGIPDRASKAFEQVLPLFLEGFSRPRLEEKEEVTRFVIDKNGVTLDLFQISDGERSMLSILMDLTRRLAQANPLSRAPIQEAEAVVLIDELDLHLHPRWQSTIVQKLTDTFPACQFIATTHSPLIISEVQPDGLTLLTNDSGQIKVIQGSQGYGLDASYILEHLMGTPSRPKPSRAQINLVEDALEEGDLLQARDHLNELRRIIHGDDDEVIRLEASINNLEALADEVDSEEE